MSLPIYSITPFTLLDYPDTTACIFWFAGCNMKCLYCYNPEIVYGKGKLGYEQALKFIDSRRNLLDGVVLSGGECTSHKNLSEFAKQLKVKGLKVKVDTNGSNPHVLEMMISEKTLDYVALDFKAVPYSFLKITQSRLYNRFEESLDLLLSRQIPFEVRTTFHSDLISRNDVSEMVQFLQNKGYKGNYFIQHFVNDTETLQPLGVSTKTFTEDDFACSDIRIIFRN